MGSFHCPVGAPSKGMNQCINCGLCTAKSKQESVLATQKIRAYLQASSSKRLSRYHIQKIAVCGKGGAGKSTVAALLAMILRDYGYEVIVLDSDESNSGFFRRLGFTSPPRPLKDMMENVSDTPSTDFEWMNKEDITLEDIPEDFIQYSNRIGIMESGKINDPLQGCACSIASTVREFIIKLRLEPKQILIIDNEAGLENFGRGVERGVDTIISVVEPSKESVEIAASIQYMSEGIGIRRIRAIVNKIQDEETKKAILDMIKAREIRYLGLVDQDSAVSRANLFGVEIGDNDTARLQMEVIVKLMLDEAEMTYIDLTRLT